MPRTAPRFSESRFLVPGVVAAVVLVVGIGPPGLLLPRSVGCELGTRLGTFTIWTLDTPLNKPPGVNVSAFAEHGAWNFTFTSGSLTVGALRPGDAGSGWSDDSPAAGVSAQGAEMNWTFFSVRNVSTVGGPVGRCTQPYVAEVSPPVVGCSGFVDVPLANNASDAVEPHVWNGTIGSNWDSFGCLPATPGASIWFDTSFHENGSGPSAPVRWDLCDVSEAPLAVGSAAEVPTVVTVPYDGREISTSGFQTWLGAPLPSPIVSGWTANYTVPGGWVWLLAPVGPVPTSLNPEEPLPALAAFERLPC